MQFLKPLKNAAHVTVGIVHAQGGLLDFAKRMLGQFDDFGGITRLEQVGNGIQDLVYAEGKIMGGAVINKSPGASGTVQRFADSGNICAPAGRFGGLQEQPFAEMRIHGGLIEQHLDEFGLVLFGEPRARVLKRDHGRVGGFCFLRWRLPGDVCEPSETDSNTMFAERAVRAHRTRAIVIKRAVANRDFDAVIFRALNRGGQFAGVFDQAHHLAGSKVILAARERSRAGKLLQRLAGQDVFELAGFGHGNGEAMSQRDWRSRKRDWDSSCE